MEIPSNFHHKLMILSVAMAVAAHFAVKCSVYDAFKPSTVQHFVDITFEICPEIAISAYCLKS